MFVSEVIDVDDSLLAQFFHQSCIILYNNLSQYPHIKFLDIDFTDPQHESDPTYKHPCTTFDFRYVFQILKFIKISF